MIGHSAGLGTSRQNASVVLLATAALALPALALLGPVPADFHLMAGSQALAGMRLLQWFLAFDGLLCGAAAVYLWQRPARLPEVRLSEQQRVEDGGFVLALIVLLALVLRLIHLDDDLWLDEIETVVSYLRLPWWKSIATYHSANQHLLYSLLGSISVHLFGEHAWSARLPAMLFGVASVVALFRLARLFAGRSESLLAAAMLAVSYHAIWFSQSARGYSGMIFFTIIGTTLFLRALEEDRAVVWSVYAVTMALGVTMLQNTAFVAAGHAAGFVVSPFARKGGRRVRVALALAGAAILSVEFHALVLPEMIRFFGEEPRTGLGWTSLGEFLPVVASGLKAGLGAAGALVILGVMLAGWVSYFRQNRMMAILGVVPVALNVAALVVLHYGAYPRSFLYVLPFAILFAVRGAMVVERTAASRLGIDTVRWNISPAALGVMILSALPLLRLYAHPKQDYSGALQWVESSRKPGDRIAAVGLAGVSYRNYFAPNLDFPRSAAELETERSTGDVWVLYSFTRDMRLRHPDLVRVLRERYRLVRLFPGTLGDGAIYVVFGPRITKEAPES